MHLQRVWPKSPGWQVAAALVAAAVVLVLDYTVPYVTLGPLMVLPVIAIAISGGLRWAVGLALVLAAGCAIVEPLSEHRPLNVYVIYNAAIFAAELIVAVALVQRWRFEKAAAGTLLQAADEAVTVAHRAFAADDARPVGWTFTIVRADATATATVADVRVRGEGVDVLVTDVASAGVQGAMVLSAVRGVLPTVDGYDPRARLVAQNGHLRPICTGDHGCRAWDARMTAGGTVRFASAGFGAATIVRADGRREPTGGGGLPLGRFVEAYIVEGLAVLDPGDTLVVLDERMRVLTELDPGIIDRLVAADPALRDDLVRTYGPRIGLALAAHRVAAPLRTIDRLRTAEIV